MARGRDVHGYTFTLSAPGTRAGASWPLRELAEHLGHSSWNPGKWCSMGAYRRCQICAAPSAVARGASCGIAIPDAAGDGPCAPLCFPGSIGCLALLGERTGALFVRVSMCAFASVNGAEAGEQCKDHLDRAPSDGSFPTRHRHQVCKSVRRIRGTPRPTRPRHINLREGP